MTALVPCRNAGGAAMHATHWYTYYDRKGGRHEVYRATCDVCHKRVRVKANGTLHVHGTRPPWRHHRTMTIAEHVTIRGVPANEINAFIQQGERS